MTWQPVEIAPRGPAADKELEQDDPFELVAVTFPVDEAADFEMARCIVEEYALMGWGREQVGRLFTTPLYAGPHDVYRRRGDEFVKRAVSAVFGEGN